MKTWVYVDAFNLYFGCAKGTPNKWLNLDQLFRLLLPQHQVERIKYFTAKVAARPGRPDSPMNQETFLRALRTLPNLEIYFGHFLTHEVMMPLVNPPPAGPTCVRVIKTEEKGSDVNLATHLLHDGHMDRYEMAVVVSGDSDLLAPVAIVMTELKKPVGVLNPQRRICRVLHRQATFYKPIRQGVLAACQFSPIMHDAQGAFHKPSNW